MKEDFERGFSYDTPKPLTKKNLKMGITAWYNWRIENCEKVLENLIQNA